MQRKTGPASGAIGAFQAAHVGGIGQQIGEARRLHRRSAQRVEVQIGGLLVRAERGDRGAPCVTGKRPPADREWGRVIEIFLVGIYFSIYLGVYIYIYT